MSVYRELRDVKHQLDVLNAKLDALMRTQMSEVEIEDIDLPKDPNTEDPDPFNVRRQKARATLPVPKATDTTEMRTVSPTQNFVPSIEPPVVETPPPPAGVLASVGGEPITGYDGLTAGQIIQMSKKWDKATVDRALDYEKKHKNRETVVQALVNWNS